MNLISIPVLMMAAVCVYVGVHYLLFSLRRRDEPENLSFALTCFSIALYDIFCVGLYNASSVADGMFWQRLQFASLALFSIAVSWFVYHFTRYGTRRPFIGITLYFSVLFILGVFVRGGLTLSLEAPKPKYVRLGDIAEIVYNEADPGLIYTIQYVSMMMLALFILYVMIRHYREGNKKRALPILAALCIFFMASVNDALVGLAAYPFIYLLEYTYMFIILSMAYVLTNSFVDLHHEVEALVARLNEKVNERSLELLFRDIGSRLYAEMLGELRGPKTRTGSALRRLMGGEAAVSLAALSRDASVIANLEELLSRVLMKARGIAGASSGQLFLLNDDSVLEARASSSETGEGVALFLGGMVGRAFGEKRFVIERARAAEQGDSMEGGNTRRMHLVCVPVLSGEAPVGVCCLARRASENPFSEKDARLLLIFLQQVAVAIENAILYRRMKKGAPARRSGITPFIEEKIKKALSFIDENYASEISRESLASSLAMHPDTLGRYFKQSTGKKISEYVNERRIRDVAERLERDPQANVIDIAFSAGFESLATFNRAFHRVMRLTPTEYRERMKK